MQIFAPEEIFLTRRGKIPYNTGGNHARGKEVGNIEELNKILKQIRKVDSVYEVKRKK